MGKTTHPCCFFKREKQKTASGINKTIIFVHILFTVMNRLIKIFFFLMVIPVAMPLHAQKQWTLQDCIQYALENNLSIKQQSLSIERDKNQLKQSRWSMGPSLNIGTDYGLSWGRTANAQDFTIIENQMSQNGRIGISSSLDIFNGLQKVNTIKSNLAQLEVSGQEVEKLKNDISIEIARTFLHVILAQEILETAKLSRKSVAEQVDRTQKLVDAGNLAQSSLLEIQAQLATEQVQVVNAQNTLRTDYLTLVQLLDLPLETNFSVAVPPFTIDTTHYVSTPTEQLYQISQSLPEIQIGEYILQQREHQLATYKGQRYPSLSLSGGIGSSYNPDYPNSFLKQLDERKSPYVSLSLNFSIFNGRRVTTSINNAKLAVQQAQIDMKSREQQMYKVIQQANNDAISAFERYKATLHNVKSMEESFRFVQQKLDVGMLSGTDYTVAKTNLFRAQSDNLQAKFQYVFQLKILDFYRGIPITL